MKINKKKGGEQWKKRGNNEKRGGKQRKRGGTIKKGARTMRKEGETMKKEGTNNEKKLILFKANFYEIRYEFQWFLPPLFLLNLIQPYMLYMVQNRPYKFLISISKLMKILIFCFK